MLFLLFCGLSIFSFWNVLNSFLQGRRKPQIDAAIGALLLGHIIAVFVLENWKVGIIAIAYTIVFSTVSAPLSRFCAHRLLSDIRWAKKFMIVMAVIIFSVLGAEIVSITHDVWLR